MKPLKWAWDSVCAVFVLGYCIYASLKECLLGEE